jgi:hypothetical protein
MRGWRGIGFLAAAMAGLCGPAGAQPGPAKATGISGIWTNTSYDPSSVYDPRKAVLRTIDGQMPPLQPWAAALLETRIKAAEEGHPFANTKSMCLTSGVPQLMFGPRTPMQILETPGQVTLLIEEFNNFRIIMLDARHVADPDPNLMGDSIGHWEGDILVVDTIGLSERSVLDVPGMPHSDQLHVVERFRRVSPTQLEVVITMDDPKTFTKAWTARATFKPMPVAKITEYYCENQRNGAVDGRTTMDMPSAAK